MSKPVDENGVVVKLKLTIDPEALTVDDLQLLMEPEEFKPSIFKAFMVRYSNWSAAQVGRLTIIEMKETLEDIGRTLMELAVPKAKKPPSEVGVG